MYKYDATLTENNHLDHLLTKHKLLSCLLTINYYLVNITHYEYMHVSLNQSWIRETHGLQLVKERTLYRLAVGIAYLYTSQHWSQRGFCAVINHCHSLFYEDNDDLSNNLNN